MVLKDKCRPPGAVTVLLIRSRATHAVLLSFMLPPGRIAPAPVLASGTACIRLSGYLATLFAFLQVSFALLVGIATSFFSTRLLVEALALTCVTVACIFVIVASTSLDFTQAGLTGRPSSLFYDHCHALAQL